MLQTNQIKQPQQMSVLGRPLGGSMGDGEDGDSFSKRWDGHWESAVMGSYQEGYLCLPSGAVSTATELSTPPPSSSETKSTNWDDLGGFPGDCSTGSRTVGAGLAAATLGASASTCWTFWESSGFSASASWGPTFWESFGGVGTLGDGDGSPLVADGLPLSASSSESGSFSKARITSSWEAVGYTGYTTCWDWHSVAAWYDMLKRFGNIVCKMMNFLITLGGWSLS